jgi:hypothetical protein
MYRDNEYTQIINKLDTIKEYADRQARTILEPTYVENIAVLDIIKTYIINKQKIVYGGMAQNLLLRHKNINDMFYKEVDGLYLCKGGEVADIEFYSTNPVSDIIQLSELLYKHKFKIIDAKEALHPYTYKLFVNFTGYCDISYMPKRLYESLKTIKVDNIRCLDPHFMIIDTLRVLTDPMNSFWRLDKVINRSHKILHYYPLDTISIKKPTKDLAKINNVKIPNEISNFILNKIIRHSQLIIVGFYAYKYYMHFIRKNKIIEIINNDDKYHLRKENSSINYCTYIEIISVNYINDCKKIYNILKSKYKNIHKKEFYPFFDFMDRRLQIYYKNILIMVIYGHHNRCIVYKISKKYNFYFGTFNLTVKYLLFNYYYQLSNKIKNDLLYSCISKLWLGRKYYLSYYNINVLNKSKFQDFTIKCIGNTIQPIRQYLLENINKKKFRYNPNGKLPIKIPNIIYPDISGNEILNKKYLIFKN